VKGRSLPSSSRFALSLLPPAFWPVISTLSFQTLSPWHFFFFQVEEKEEKHKEKKIIEKKKNAKKGRRLPFFFRFAFGMKHSSCFLLSTFLQC